MSRLRFTTAHEVLEAFPTARQDIGVNLGVDLGDEPPVTLLRRLSEGAAPDAAISFCAYLLPRREAVWWGCRSIRILFPHAVPGATVPRMSLEAAEAWVNRPEDALRRKALASGMGGDRGDPASWLALGAGWAGGSMTAGDYAVPAPAHLTAKAVRAALLLALGIADPLSRGENVKRLVAVGIGLARGDETI